MIVIYDHDHPNPCELSDADGHRIENGVATPIYHESHIPEELRTEPVEGHPGYFYGGPN